MKVGYAIRFNFKCLNMMYRLLLMKAFMKLFIEI